MKKVLFVATVAQKHINVFHLPFLEWFQNKGYKTYVAAANDTACGDVNIPYCDEYVEIDFKRNPLNPKNLLCFLKLRKIINEQNFDIIHCHTPVGGLLGRLASAKARKKGTRVFYTAHGFHFYKGAPLKNWLLYYPVEKFCARYTDKLITINQEDFDLAKRNFEAKEVLHVPGVGIDLEKFQGISVDRSNKRTELGLPEDSLILFSVGELNKNKNHQIVIKAMGLLQRDNLYYMIAGIGPEESQLKALIKELNLEEKVLLLGYRYDMAELYKIADVFVFPSYREGLSVSIMEAMASGLPCAVSRIRGNADLIRDDGGALFDPNSLNECCQAIDRVLNSDMSLMGKINSENATDYSTHVIVRIMESIYES